MEGAGLIKLMVLKGIMCNFMMNILLEAIDYHTTPGRMPAVAMGGGKGHGAMLRTLG